MTEYSTCFRDSKKPPKQTQTRFHEPLETQFDAGDSVFTVDGHKRSKSAIPIGGSSFRSPNAPSLQYVDLPLNYLFSAPFCKI